MTKFEWYGCGSTAEGELGLGGIDEPCVSNMCPLRPSQLFADVRLVASSDHHTLVALTDGSVYTFGNNDFGQLGRDGQRKKPDLVPALKGLSIRQIACGIAHSAALTEDGHLVTWGSNSYGQLGEGVDVAVVDLQLRANEINLTKIVQVCCGGFHNLALGSDGTVFSWGRNDCGQLGLGHRSTVHNPAPIKSINGIPFRQLCAGHAHSFVLSLSGALFGWGKNTFGQLGTGSTEDQLFPTLVGSLRHQKIVRIVCGADFSAAVTIEGRLFTFGAGMYGQLGHGSTNNEVLPKQVLELMGSKVIDVACGRCHTLVLTTGKLYAFGLGTSGQLGIASSKGCTVPCPVVVEGDVIRVFAAGDHSFVATASQGSGVQSTPLIETQSHVKGLTLDLVSSLLKADPNKLLIELEEIFSSLSCINCSFLTRGDEHFCASKTNSGVNLDDVMSCFQLLSESEISQRVEDTIAKALEWSLLSSLSRPPPHIEALRVYLILPWCSVFNDCKNYRTLHVPLANAMVSIGEVPWKVIRHWWHGLPVRHLNRVLKVFKQVVTHILDLQKEGCKDQSDSETIFRETAIRTCLELLSHLNKVNKTIRKIPFNNFYIEQLADCVDIRTDYVRWIQSDDNRRFSFCNYPFVFNAAVKTMLLQTDVAVQMQILIEETNRFNLHSLFVPSRPQISPFLILHVSRDNLLQDTLGQLEVVSSLDIKKPLKVKFDGEEADDVGGVKKEFFMLLFQELLSPKYGMFDEYPESRRLWFSTLPFEEPKMFQLVGILCGLAIYNNVIVAFPFPLAMYKKLLKEEVTLEDLKELSPTEGRSLEALLDYENDDFEDVFCLSFEITISILGTTQNVPLKDGGAQIPVTKENRQEYVDLYVDYKLNKANSVHFNGFASGFHKVVTSHILNFFQPQELMEMVVGNEVYDWDEFERNTQYQGEYWHSHPVIKVFWEVFHSLNLQQKKKFLLFLTGSDRVPILGMKQIKVISTFSPSDPKNLIKLAGMFIQPTQGGDDYYPVAHTCFNLLDLPKTTNKAKMTKKLLEAIENTQGFTLV